MIGKGRFFDIISRTADDANNPENNIDILLQNFKQRYEKRNKGMNSDNR